MKLNIVLIRPEIPQNTGNIARTCSATGARLHIVHPIGFSLDEKHLRRAGLDYWGGLDITEYDNVDAFLTLNGTKQLYFFTSKAFIPYTEVDYSSMDEVYLVFGPESVGLDNELLNKYQNRCLRIPMLKGKRSLNLSNSVAIAAYEVFRQTDFDSLAFEDITKTIRGSVT